MDDVLTVYQEFMDAGEFVPEEVVEVLAAEVRGLRAKVERLAECERVNALHEAICNELHALHTIDDDGRFCEACDDFWPCRTMKVFQDHDAALSSRGEDAGA